MALLDIIKSYYKFNRETLTNDEAVCVCLLQFLPKIVEPFSMNFLVF